MSADSRSRGESSGARQQVRELSSRGSRPIVFVIASLIILAVVPTAMTWQVSRVRNELRNTTRPARAWLSHVHVGLALAATAVRTYLVTRDPAQITAYEQAKAQEANAYQQLEPLLADMGPDVRERFESLRQISKEWHDLDSRVLRNRTEDGESQLSRTERFEAALIGAAVLDEAITNEVASDEGRLVRRERIALMVAYAAFLVGIVAVFVTARLGNRLRSYAQEAVKRQAELAAVMASKEQLLHGLAHDVKNPLGAIQGYAYLLERETKGRLSPGQQEYLARIDRSVDDAVSIIDSLLLLARLESTQLPLHSDEVQMDDLVHRVVDQYRGAFEAKGINVNVEEPASMPTVWTDSERVTQVVSNLLSNARKYTPPGGSVDVRVRPAPAPGDGAESGVAIDVQDTGPGIPREEQEHVFAEFTRLAPDANTPGAGIGLTISRKLARLLGGDISLRSEVGRGSVFTLWLPQSPNGGGEHRSGHPASNRAA
jgi:signal transduction histidine kinase